MGEVIPLRDKLSLDAVLLTGLDGGAVQVLRAPRRVRFSRQALLGPAVPLCIEVERPEWLGGWPNRVKILAANGTWVYQIDTFSTVDHSMTAHLIEGEPLL